MTVAELDRVQPALRHADWQVVSCTDQPLEPPAGVVAVLYSATLVVPWPDSVLAWQRVGLRTGWIRRLQDALRARDLVLRSVHPVARLHPPAGSAESRPWLGVWAEVRHYRHRPVAGSPEVGRHTTPTEERIVALAEADRSAGVSTERWYRDRAEYFESLYLTGDDEFHQSGKAGDAADWELSRRIIASAIDGSGTFLDIGCANGLLLQSLLAWAGRRGHRIVPFGVDLVPKLVELAQVRLAEWPGHVYHGNAATWTPPRRFDFVHTLLEYVPPSARPGYVERLLRSFLAKGGRLIVSDYGHGDDELSAAAALRSWGIPVTGEAIQQRGPGRPAIQVCWIDRRDEA